MRLGHSLMLVFFLANCGVETVVHSLEEREANEITELLADSDISSTKGVSDNGRTISYTISVPAKNKVDAIRLLNRNEMPRRPNIGYTEVFKDGGLIPTAAEERTKQLAALEGEIEKQLKLVPGILDAQVQLVIPEESALRTAQEVRAPATGSVTLKYLPAAGGAKPLSEPQVQAVMAAGVERLTPDNVVVVMMPAVPIGRDDHLDNSGRGFAGLGFSNLKGRQMSIVAITLVALVLILCVVLLVVQIRLRTVRGRLLRLQAEIARARRKPGELQPAPPTPPEAS